eukprot:4042068-Prymnesium_polylepis.1
MATRRGTCGRPSLPKYGRDPARGREKSPGPYWALGPDPLCHTGTSTQARPQIRTPTYREAMPLSLAEKGVRWTRAPESRD